MEHFYIISLLTASMLDIGSMYGNFPKNRQVSEPELDEDRNKNNVLTTVLKYYNHYQ